MTTLILGGTGSIGRSIAEQLARDETCVVVAARREPQGGAYGRFVRADVTRLGIFDDSKIAAELEDSITHIVTAFGSVDWSLTATKAVALHDRGMHNVLDLASRCRNLQSIVHVSSILVFGRSSGAVGNRELDVGQTFRNWYEFGKFRAERLLRQSGLDYRIVRLGPVLGESVDETSLSTGITALLPALLRGYPLPLYDGGRFPCYCSDAQSAAKVVLKARSATSSLTWTWYDPGLPTLEQVLTALCRPWHAVPRIMNSSRLRIWGGLARLLGVPEALLGYRDPWVEFEPNVLGDLPSTVQCAEGYLRRAAVAIRESGFAVVDR